MFTLLRGLKPMVLRWKLITDFQNHSFNAAHVSLHFQWSPWKLPVCFICVQFQFSFHYRSLSLVCFILYRYLGCFKSNFSSPREIVQVYLRQRSFFFILLKKYSSAVWNIFGIESSEFNCGNNLRSIYKFNFLLRFDKLPKVNHFSALISNFKS